MKLPAARVMAEIWGISVPTVYARRCGRARTPVDDVARLARVLSLDVADLVAEFEDRRRRWLRGPDDQSR